MKAVKHMLLHATYFHVTNLLYTDRLVISDLLDGLTSGDFWLKAVKHMLLHATCCVRNRTRAHARRERHANDTKQQAILANKG